MGSAVVVTASAFFLLSPMDVPMCVWAKSKLVSYTRFPRASQPLDRW